MGFNSGFKGFNGSYKETGNRTVCGFIFEVVSWPRFLNVFFLLYLFSFNIRIEICGLENQLSEESRFM